MDGLYDDSGVDEVYEEYHDGNMMIDWTMMINIGTGEYWDRIVESSTVWWIDMMAL